MAAILKQLAKRVIPAPIWHRLRLMRLHRHVAHFPARQVRHNYGNHPLIVELVDGLGTGWYDHDWPRLTEIELLSRGKLKPGARVFDLGAHQGVVAMMLAHEVGESGAVIAVEGSAHNARAARRNSELNGLSAITVRHAVVADKPGFIEFNEGLNGQVDDGTGQWGRVRVAAVTIDQLAAQYGTPDILFIDVEGFETAALKGAEKTLASSPDSYVEVHVNHGLETFGSSAQEVLSFFPDDRFERWVWGKGMSHPVAFSPELDLLRDHFMLCARSRQ